MSKEGGIELAGRRCGGREMGGRRAFALVMVLTTLSALLMLAVAILGLAADERAMAGRGSGEQVVGGLGEVASALVVSQLRRMGGRVELGEAVLTMPGAAASYRGEGGFGEGLRLYSHARMVVEDEDELLDDAPPAGWRDRPADYVDLNAPVRVAGGALMFPVADPSGVGEVEGFRFDVGGVEGGRMPDAGTGDPGRLPMPVRWLYMLRDQTLGLLDGEGVFVGFGGESADLGNPVVGRVAFWTDDETCKLNINTASQGTYWDTPKVTTRTDRNSGRDQPSYTTSVPAFGEFQRYPGHPATVSMSAALGRWLPVPGTPHGASSAIQRGSYVAALEPYYEIAPRVGARGSEGGTLSNTEGGDQAAYLNVARDADRLYASWDELLMRPDRRAGTREVPGGGRGLDAGAARSLGFLVTAHSQAPDTTVFGTPRMGMFPQYADGGGARGAMSNLLRFCSTLGLGPDEQRYYFQRRQAWNGNMNQSSAASATRDMEVLRNRELYTYLQRLATAKQPGYGASFVDKYGIFGRDQLLTQSFDYIRSAVHMTHNADGSAVYSSGDRHWTIPLQIQSESGDLTMGMGRNVTITEAAMIFWVARREGEGAAAVDYVKAALVLEPYLVAPGFRFSPQLRVRISGLDGMAVGNLDGAGGRTELDFPASAVSTNAAHAHVCSGNSRMPFTGIYELLTPEGWGRKVVGYTNTSAHYPFVSRAEFAVPAGSQRMSFYGGAITIELQEWGAGNPTYQTLRMRFPDEQEVPVPVYEEAWSDFNRKIRRAFTYDQDDSYFGGMRDRLIRPGDVVRSVELLGDGPSGGDVRLVAGLAEVPEEFFGVHPKYGDPAVRQVHSLVSSKHGCGDVWWNGDLSHTQFGWLAASGFGAQPPFSSSGAQMDNRHLLGSPVPGMAVENFDARSVPYVMRLSTGRNAAGRPGDFDTGQGMMPDGPYIRKADETMAGDTWRDWWASGWYGSGAGANRFTPNRQVASPVEFGSLPTGVSASDPRPWQTLLFCPNPASRVTPSTGRPVEADHFGFVSPPDHRWLDFFTMPAVEPWAVSTPLATAGRINLNHRLAGFPHIERTTALRGALRGVRQLGVVQRDGVRENASDITYKVGSHSYETRYDIDAEKTLEGFRRRFAGQDGSGRRLFLTPSEICEVFLVPGRMAGASYGVAKATSSVTYDNIVDWWNRTTNSRQDNHFALTGDNAREEPYNRLYPLVTTRSNTFTVHMWVEALRPGRVDAAAGRWTEEGGQVQARRREAVVLERYVDPQDPRLPDFAKDWNGPGDESLENHYQYRVVMRQRM
jgi:uncharacterized protein (TIGR02600 family)